MSPENIMLALPTLITMTLGAHIFSAFISKEPIRSLFIAWVELSLRLPFSAYYQLMTCHGFLDRLRIIAPTEAVSVFSIAPQLREVHCDDLRNACNFFAFPQDRVGRFSSRVDSKEDLASLTLLPTVKDLSLHCYVDSYPQDLYAQWTAQVTSLHMHQHVNGPQALARLYSALNLPSLVYLHFHFENYTQGYDLPIVSDSNRHTVTTLELTGHLKIEQGIHSIYDFLRSFPNLRRLILRIKDVPASLYVLLTYHAQPNLCDHLNMLPRLEILKLPIANISINNIFQRFVEMVRSRSVTRYGRDDHQPGDPLTCARLKEVQVGFGRVVVGRYMVWRNNPGPCARLDEAIADGLVLRDREAVSRGWVGGQLVSEE
ncbi:uncharacterized protein ARMOST_17675 [Armillaria ostoyae]|uniref:F-box domain-containing protein n=1 Tax=Armillaria ostoyae TaxID=47428 RepID=A0A284RZN2_ARMOS|nr:uncharacterized protein ARMOST_17675 [Armillaria ostoyae]